MGTHHSPTLERVPGCEPLCSYNKASPAVNVGRSNLQKAKNTGQPIRHSQIMAGSGAGGGSLQGCKAGSKGMRQAPEGVRQAPEG